MVRKLSTIALLAVGLVVLSASASLGGDVFLKGGYKLFRGEDADQFNTFIISGGSDYGLLPFFRFGFEIQYSQQKIEDFKFHWLNLYLNGKAYVSGGVVRPFIGGGVGLQTSTSWAGKLEDTDITSGLGYQLFGGVTIGPPGFIGLILEAQLQLPKNLDGITAIHLMAGITW